MHISVIFQHYTKSEMYTYMMCKSQFVKRWTIIVEYAHNVITLDDLPGLLRLQKAPCILRQGNGLIGSVACSINKKASI